MSDAHNVTAVGRLVDCDQHLMEPSDMWASYADPSDRNHVLRLAPDDLGHWWLMHGEQRLSLAFRQLPGQTEAVGEQVQAARRGEPAGYTYDEIAPPEYTDPKARLEVLDAQGLDATVLFPNYGLGIERPLLDDVPALQVNMTAWNRYAIDVSSEGSGRLHPVGHLTLEDPDWVADQLTSLDRGGIRAAMVAPALVRGKRLSDPELRATWARFVEHGVTPVFHVGNFLPPFDEAWMEGDPDPSNPVLSSVFLYTPAALALTDLIVHGVLEELPELRIGVMELSAVWVPLFLLMIDGGFEFHARFNGAPLSDLALKPSEYLRRQVRIAAFAYEAPERLIRRAGDLFMMCSDYPHSEGTATPIEDYHQWCPHLGSPDDEPGLFGDNVSWLLGGG